MKEFFNSLSPLVRNIIILILFLIFVFFVYRIFKYFKDLADEKNFKNTVNDAESELKKLLKTQRPNYPDSSYSGWANQLQLLVEGCDFDTNTPDVLAIFTNIKNDVDYLKLLTAFGVRDIDECGFAWVTGSYSADLPTLFVKETASGIKQLVNAYFIKQGLKSRL